MQAALEGKPVECCDRAPGSLWGPHFGKLLWNWEQYKYRVEQEPTYKPWDAATFRWPDCLRRRDVGDGPGLPFAVVSVRGPSINTSDPQFSNFSGYCYTWQGLLDHCEASYDRGATWQRCGEVVK